MVMIQMNEDIEYRLKIRKIEKSSDADYASALQIYNGTTPYEIKTNTNEITAWLDMKSPSDKFEPLFFVLYFNDKISGFAMMTYIQTQRIVILEYIALAPEYRVNTVFYSYVSLLENYLNLNNYDVSFVINEVSYRRNGEDIDKESQLFSKLLCIEGYGKIDALYLTPPLGVNNYESSFDAYLFVKSSGDLHAIEHQTYVDIVNAIYFDYFLEWYKPFLDTTNIAEYENNLKKSYQKIMENLSPEKQLKVTYSDCPILRNSRVYTKTAGLPPTIKKAPKTLSLLFLSIIVILCPIIIIYCYNAVLSLLSIQLGTASEIIGNCLGAIITSGVTLYIARKRL